MDNFELGTNLFILRFHVIFDLLLIKSDRQFPDDQSPQPLSSHLQRFKLLLEIKQNLNSPVNRV